LTKIEKASDALWNLLLRIWTSDADLGDNRRVDFSRLLIFHDKHLGAPNRVQY